MNTRLNVLVILLMSSLLGCQKVEVEDSISQIEILEKKYNVKIENTKGLVLSLEDLRILEEDIVETKAKINSLDHKNVKMECLHNHLKTKSIESFEMSQWAFNLSWIHVAVSIENDELFSVDSWLTGVTVYNYSQKNLSNDFKPKQYQCIVKFSFTALCTFAVADLVGINYTIQGKVDGTADFSNMTGSFSTRSF